MRVNRNDAMKFLSNYWLEALMITPLFFYILGFTFLPVATNVKASFIDQQYGRKFSLLTERIKDIKYDIGNTPDEEERVDLLIELKRSEKELQDLKEKEGGFSLSNWTLAKIR